MARGLAALADGFSEGYVTGSKLKAQREQAENDKKRLGFEESRVALERDRYKIEQERAQRDKEQFGLTKQLTNQQIESGAIDLEARKREQEFQKNQSARLADLVNQSRGGVQIDVIDPTGKSVGPMTFGTMEDATRDLQAKGLTFKPGSIKKLEPLNPVDMEMRAADIMLEEALRYGKVTPELLKEAKNRRKEAEREGAIEALRYFHTTRDEAGAKKMFNKNGKIKIGDDVKLDFKDGMFGPTVVGYRVGKDGKREEVFDGFRDIILPSMGAEAYATTMATFKVTEVKEAGDNKRNAASNATSYGVAAMNNKGAMDRELIQQKVNLMKQKDPAFEQLEGLVMGQGKAAISNPSNAMNIDKYTMENLDVLNYAYALYKDGKAKTIPEAAAMATRAVRAAKNQPGK